MCHYVAFPPIFRMVPVSVLTAAPPTHDPSPGRLWLPATLPRGLSLERAFGAEAAAYNAELTGLVALSHPEHVNDPEHPYSPAGFSTRMSRQSGRPGFELYAIRETPRAVGPRRLAGFLYGTVLQSDSPWWDGVQPSDPRAPLAPEYVKETGDRTAMIGEILVAPRYRRQGIGDFLTEEFLRAHPTQRTTLAVEPDNQRAIRFYLSHGFRLVGTVPEADDLRIMMRDAQPLRAAPRPAPAPLRAAGHGQRQTQPKSTAHLPVSHTRTVPALRHRSGLSR